MSDMTIQATIERPDGVRVSVSGRDAIDVMQTMIMLAAKVGAEAQPSSLPDAEVDRIAERAAVKMGDAMADAVERRRDRVTVPSGTYISPASRDE